MNDSSNLTLTISIKRGIDPIGLWEEHPDYEASISGELLVAYVQVTAVTLDGRTAISDLNGISVDGFADPYLLERTHNCIEECIKELVK